LWSSAGLVIVAAAFALAAERRTEGTERGDSLSLLRAALMAGDVESVTDVAESVTRFQQHCAALRSAETVRGTTGEQAAAIFAFLHREILTSRYDADCTELAQTLTTGRYNCVSATILFQCLSREFGLHAVVLESADHMFCRVHTPKGDLDLETTCPEWFNLSANERRHADGSFRAIGAVCYNRGVECLRREEFAASLTFNEAALRLDPDSAIARGNLLATYNNWAVSMARSGDFSAALSILERGRALAPDHEPFGRNANYFRAEWAKRQ
jgi:tetratricopeptide (TPR) repeat protein